MSDDDETPTLPADTLAILNEFLEQRKQEEIGEDWQLSQFWYDDNTTNILTKAVKNSGKNGKIALISCPTLMQPLLDEGADVTLLEYDIRFSKYGERFISYDYREPKKIPENLKGAFDIVVADPPFLSEECLTKALETVRLLLRNENGPIILCTGAVMESLAGELADLKPCSFIPRHKNNLANEFRCYTNFGELQTSNNGD